MKFKKGLKPRNNFEKKCIELLNTLKKVVKIIH